MQRCARFLFATALLACGGAQPEAVVTTPAAEEPIAEERACFSGTTDNGVCEIFSAALEPLPALASHCIAAHGHWLEECPAEGRVGSCAGEGRRAFYYGVGLGSAQLRQACEAEGHSFSP